MKGTQKTPTPSPRSRRSPVPYVTVLALLAAGAVAYSFVTLSRKTTYHARLVDAATEIRIETTTAHLCFMEAIIGNRHEEIVSIREHLEHSAWYARLMLNGGENTDEIFPVLRDLVLRRRIEDALTGISDLRAIAENWMAVVEQPGSASAADQRFNAIFEDVVGQVNAVVTTLRAATEKNLRQVRLLQTLLIAAFLGLAALVGLMYWRDKRCQALNTTALRESESLYRGLTEDSPGLICRFLPNGEIIYVNEACCRYFNKAFPELVGSSIRSLISEGDQETVMTNILSLTAESPTQSHEHQVVSPDGEVGWQRWTNRALFDDGGKIVAYQSVGEDITERKQAEEELRRSEARARAVIDASRDAIIALDLDTNIVVFNPAAEALFGVPAAEMIGGPMDRLIPPEVRGLHLAAAQKCLRTGISKGLVGTTLEVTALRADGSEVPIEMSLAATPNVGTMRVVAILRDITERTQWLLRTEVFNRIATAIDSAPNLVALLSVAHNEIKKLMAAENFSVVLYDPENDLYSCPYCVDKHKSAEDLPGDTPRDDLTDYVRRTQKPLLADTELMRQLMESGDIKHTGTSAPAWMGVPLMSYEGVIGVLTVQCYESCATYGPEALKDLAEVSVQLGHAIERKRLEEKNVRLATVVSQVDESIMITDINGIIQYVNPSFEWTTGYTSAEVLGQTPHILSSNKHDRPFFAEMWNSIRHGRTWSGRIINRKKDGTIYHEETTITPIRDLSGTITNFVAVKHDVTEELMLDVQHRQTQKLEAIGSLAAGIAHEINTPIQFVGDNVHFLDDAFNDLQRLLDKSLEVVKSFPADETVAESVRGLLAEEETCDLAYMREEIPKAIAQSLEGVTRVATIVQAMKEFSHPGQGDKTRIDLNRALESTLTVARNELKYVADVVTDLDPDLPLVSGYADDINQVFLNLLVNAAHAIKDVVGTEEKTKGVITVATRRDGGNVVVSIKDTGSGIPEAVRERVFEPFFTTKGVGKGTGQGLAIAHSAIVDKHGGTLTFETAENKGTTFYVCLPIGEGETVGVS